MTTDNVKGRKRSRVLSKKTFLSPPQRSQQATRKHEIPQTNRHIRGQRALQNDKNDDNKDNRNDTIDKNNKFATPAPSRFPTSSPTTSPPTDGPTKGPTVSPTTSEPTIQPTNEPTTPPTNEPTTPPTNEPTNPPTSPPTTSPTTNPAASATPQPTTKSSPNPTFQPESAKIVGSIELQFSVWNSMDQNVDQGRFTTPMLKVLQEFLCQETPFLVFDQYLNGSPNNLCLPKPQQRHLGPTTNTTDASILYVTPRVTLTDYYIHPYPYSEWSLSYPLLQISTSFVHHLAQDDVKVGVLYLNQNTQVRLRVAVDDGVLDYKLATTFSLPFLHTSNPGFEEETFSKLDIANSTTTPDISQVHTSLAMRNLDQTGTVLRYFGIVLLVANLLGFNLLLRLAKRQKLKREQQEELIVETRGGLVTREGVELMLDIGHIQTQQQQQQQQTMTTTPTKGKASSPGWKESPIMLDSDYELDRSRSLESNFLPQQLSSAASSPQASSPPSSKMDASKNTTGLMFVPTAFASHPLRNLLDYGTTTSNQSNDEEEELEESTDWNEWKTNQPASF